MPQNDPQAPAPAGAPGSAATPRRAPGNRIRLSAAAALVLTAVVPLSAFAGTANTGAKTAVHRTYRQTLDAYTPRFATPIAPGVDLTGYSSAAGGHTTNSDVTTVDLTHPGVSAGVLSNKVTGVEPVQTWAQNSGAVAAVNGDYFDIGASEAPIGAVVRDGILRKGNSAGQSMTGEGTDGALRTSTVYLDGTVTWGSGAAHKLNLYNSDLTTLPNYPSGTIPTNGLAVLDGGWGASPLLFNRPPKKVAVAFVGANHKITSVTTKLTAHMTVPSHGLLLVGTGSYADIAKLKKGTPVTDTIGMTTDAAYPFSWGLGAGLLLMRNGSVIHNYKDDTDPHDARTALGWSDGGRTMIMITVEYGGGSLGEGVNEIADELAAAGATDGVLLDGGGSTTLVARGQGLPASSQIGPVSNYGNVERSVPIAVGVFVPKGSGQVFGLAPTLDGGTVFPGLHRQLGYRAWDEWYGPATLDPSTTVVTSDNPGLFTGAGPTEVLAVRPGAGHVVATAPATAPGSTGTATGSVYLKVLQPLATLNVPATTRLVRGVSLPLPVTGFDAQGESAPILTSDLKLTYNGNVMSVSTAPDGSLLIKSNAPEGTVTPLTMSVQGISATVAVHVGYATVPVLNPAGKGALTVQNGTSRIVPLGHGVVGLKVSPGKSSASAIAKPAVAFPAGTARLGVTFAGDGLKHAVGAVIIDKGGHQHRINFGVLSGKASKRFEATVPAGSSLLGISIGKASGKTSGYVSITQVVARV